jgi:phosphatidate cytidylyltransferase
MSPHLKRWVTGILAAPVLGAIVYFGNEAVFAGLVIIAAVMGCHEYNKTAFTDEYGFERAQCLGAALLINIAAFYSNPDAGGPKPIAAAVTLSFLAMFSLFLYRCRQGAINIEPLRKTVLSIFYPSLLTAHFILLRKLDNGIFLLFLVFLIAFAGDIAAFYTGRNFGKRKLLPNVSAGKTIEGSLGSIVGSIAAALVFRHFFLPWISVPNIVIMTLAANILGQVGDLCESTLKRSSGIKDSGAILPGHGGVLDRIDSLLFIGPFVYYYISYFVL